MKDIMVHQIQCGEIWGGNRGDQLDVATSGIRGSLFSRACDGGKGGDIYFLSVCGNDVLTRIAIADVVGHGESVSNTSGWLYEALKTHMDSGDGSQVLAELNRRVSEFGLKAMTTAAVAAFYREDSSLYYCYAGHHELLIRRKGGTRWELIEIPESDELSGLPLGVIDGSTYTQECLAMMPGDQIFLYTDGLVEAGDSDGKLFGLERLRQALDSSPQDTQAVRQQVCQSLLDFTGNSFGHDDVTFMVIEISE